MYLCGTGCGSMSTTRQETKRCVSLLGQATDHSSKCGSRSWPHKTVSDVNRDMAGRSYWLGSMVLSLANSHREMIYQSDTRYECKAESQVKVMRAEVVLPSLQPYENCSKEEICLGTGP